MKDELVVIEIEKYLALMGMRVRDRITRMEGIVTTVGFDLYGCVQCIVNPGMVNGKPGESLWFDAKRLEVLNDVPVMIPPMFVTKIPNSDQRPKSQAVSGPEPKQNVRQG